MLGNKSERNNWIFGVSSGDSPEGIVPGTERLRELGYRVDVNPVDFINYCLVEMCGHAVFSCNLRHLRYNTQYRRDEICRRAVDTIVEATESFNRARTCLWINNMIDDAIFKRSEYAANDYWIDTFEDLRPFSLDVCCPGPGICKCPTEYPKIAETHEEISEELTSENTDENDAEIDVD